MTEIPWSGAEFEQQLRERGRAYHIHHPFNVMLNSGKATPAQIRGSVANRFYYQISIPRKDAGILANCEERAVRQLVTALERTYSATELSHDVTAFLTFALAKRWLELRE